ncbi:uncharacterized protein TRAVEDRAFT_52745 [Trametes versicolor FP-101664 SS1]|uniref:uncharacterized protein n=1 Tax=Trametes versicolor (strain FP-101664) TaxID=717944 RepID=UPI0004621E35|nr:uncharacterized protein TRAVEDRAFT_52745 [Trametes versicolor FP-101664 SS1]EIW53626.1 hypothetical protein TRAVEDRAFT_52745 [Trametes versicolor FP-101664 SS1]
MRQRFRFTDDKSHWLQQHLSDADVQSILQEPRTTAPNKRAAGLLTEKFRAHFTAPSTGETQAAWLKRYNNASRERRNDLVRHVPEDILAFSARMQMLPKNIYNWLRENRYTGERLRGHDGRRRSLTLPRPRKSRTKTGLDVFQVSPDAPQIEVLDLGGRPRAAIGQLRAACAHAWKILPPEEQDIYNAVAQEKNEELAAEREESVPINGGFTSLEISNAVDDSMDMIHNVRWGGLICVGGPDETGEPSVYMTSRGVNRQGLTFLQALCQTAGWTEQEFYLVLSLWVEQSRSADQDVEAVDFGRHTQRVMEERRADDARDKLQRVVQTAPVVEDVAVSPAPILTACIDPTLRAPPTAPTAGRVIEGKSIVHVGDSNDDSGPADMAGADMDVHAEVSVDVDIAAAAEHPEPANARRKGQRIGKKGAKTKGKAKGARNKVSKVPKTSGVAMPDASERGCRVPSVPHPRADCTRSGSRSVSSSLIYFAY